MSIIEVAGSKVGFDEDGRDDGPPIILLHGATTTGRAAFGPILPALADDFRLLMPDARGHGRTEWPSGQPFETEGLAGDVVGFADRLGLETFHLLGFSMGAITALFVATGWPERLRSLVVIGNSPPRQPRGNVARNYFDPDRIEREEPAYAARLARDHDPGLGDGGWRRLVTAIAEDVWTQRLLTPRDLRRVEMPSLVVAGDRDPFTPVGHAHELARQLRRAGLLIVPDWADHVAWHAPEILAAELRRFYGQANGPADGPPAAGPSAG